MMIDPSGFPMMARHEVKIINDLLCKYKPEICLEWGSGNSTVYFPNEHKFIRQWVSIEHICRYITYLQDKIDIERVVHLWVSEDEWYVDCVKHQGKKYDFILIDGLQREKCLKIAHEIAKEGGIILLHDSGRKEYEQFLSRYPNKEILCEGDNLQPKGGFAHRGLTLFRV